MKLILMAFAVAGFIGSATTFGLAAKVSSEEAKKIKAALEAFGCTGGKMEKADEEGSALPYEVEDAKCRGGDYNMKLDKNFNVFIILRD